ncbi:DcuS/MalK family sensor histidine kinase [Fictibacillus gelatini]|uniref:DcuS/MalK family sensor histidine kinase n=1 Tax=Fictibacillus gelatini TaxID=225985 RepID=UPI0003F83C8E|nr:DcuS/MalK family sensor histidine kinase [Fictibacillus gelatini]
MKVKKTIISLNTTIALFVCTVVVLALTVTGILTAIDIANKTEKSISEKAMDIARVVAHSPLVIEALEEKRNESVIQQYAEEVRRLTHVRYIVVMDKDHIRKSHPDKSKIGKHFVGNDEERAFRGKEYTSTARGSLGKSMRAFEPIYNAKGKEIGVVAVGIMLTHVKESIAKSTKMFDIGIGTGILVGIFGALLLARKIKKVLFGLEPYEIAKFLQERNAMLESVKEGILAVNKEGKIILANAAAIRMFKLAGFNENPLHKNVEEYLPETRFGALLESGSSEFDKEYELNGISLVVNRMPIKVEGQVVGGIATFRDKTELKKLAEQLTGVKAYVEALRVNTHEFMNKLHVMLGMVHIGEYEKLSAYIHSITNHYQMEIGAVSRIVKDPVLAGFLLSKISYAREQAITLLISGKNVLPEIKNENIINELITILGNLIDNAIEAAEGQPNKEVNVDIAFDGDTLSFSVKDYGEGIHETIKENIFKKGFSTKGSDRGFGLYLVQSSVEKLGGTFMFNSRENETIFTVHLPYIDRDDSW